MTIIFKASWNGYEQGTVQNLGSTEEARLIAAGIAAAHTATAAQRIRGDAVVNDVGQVVVRNDAAGGQVVVGGGDNVSRLSSFEIPRACQGHWALPNCLNIDGGNKAYVGYAGEDGEYGVALVDFVAGSIKSVVIDKAESDDHNVPSFCLTTGAKNVIAAYATHSLRPVMHVAPDAFAGAAEFRGRQPVTGSDIVTYNQIHKSIGADGVPWLYLFYRTGNSDTGRWNVRVSKTDGATWEAEVPLIDAEYIYTALNGSGTSIRIYAYEHPIVGTDHDIFYCQLDTVSGNLTLPGSVTVANSNIYTVGSALPMATSALMKAVDITAGTSRLFNAAGPSAGTVPALLACEFDSAGSATNGAYYRYVYASAGALFTKKLICQSGGPFFQGSSWYYPGVCFAHGSQDTVYVCRREGSTYYLDKMVTTDAGNTWTTTNLVTSQNRLVRPTHLQSGYVVYTEFSRYDAYTDFDATLKFVQG